MVYMHRINIVLAVILIIITTGCKIRQPDTAVLSECSKGMIDYFLHENNDDMFTENTILVLDCMFDEIYVSMNICCLDTTISKPYGRYNGRVHYKGHDILLFGYAWNDFFWTCDTIYNIPHTLSDNFGMFYDPIEWDICIKCEDTTIVETNSEFPYYLSCPISYKEYSGLLCDSLQKIIRKF